MQRDIAEILRRDFERFLDQQIALGHIGFDQHLIGNFIHLLVAVAAEIGFTARGFRIVAAAHDVVENVVGVKRAGSPAQQIERCLETTGFQYLGEILRLGLRQQINLDADTGQHADDRLADRGIIDVAVVGAIHRDFETVGIAGFRQKLFGPFRIELRSGEILR